MTDLLQEYVSYSPTDAQVAWMQGTLDIPADIFFSGATLCGVGKVAFDGGTFVPDTQRGAPSIIAPCGFRGPNRLGWQTVDDMVAFRPSSPNDWACRSRLCPILGEESVEVARWNRIPLLLHSNPLDWLRAGGQGAVILNWHRSPRLWLSDVSVIICDTVALGRRLSDALRQASLATPEIRISREVHRAVA